MTELDRKKLIVEALTWLGTPYHSGARVKGAGVDCGQLLIGIYENAGMLAKGDCEPGYYSPEWHLHRSEEKYLEWVRRYCFELLPGEPALPGDIAVFQFGRCISHGAMVVKWPEIIHAYVGYGVIISQVDEALLLDPKGKSRLKGVYRFGRTVRQDDIYQP